MVKPRNKRKVIPKKKERLSKKPRQITSGRLYVIATFNNTLATVTDSEGKTLCSSSTGQVGFKGSRKSTPFAATKTIEDVLNKARKFGLQGFEVYIKGPGPGRETALRVLRNSEFKISLLADVTPIPHNGPRPEKKRRG